MALLSLSYFVKKYCSLKTYPRPGQKANLHNSKKCHCSRADLPTPEPGWTIKYKQPSLLFPLRSVSLPPGFPEGEVELYNKPYC